MNHMKKIGVLALAMFTSFALCAFPGHFHHHGFHHHHHYGTGFAIGAGILGAGLLASAVYDATHPYYYAPAPVVATPVVQPVVTTPVVQPVVTTPVVQPVVQQPVVQQPVVQQPVVQAAPQNVWVEGRYVEQVNAQGQTVRVWQPGHYEAR